MEIKTSNPGPLGLIGFGMTTVLLNIHNAGFTPLDNTVLAMGIFVGGLAQVVAGILEGKKDNTFGLTAFTAYGFFWMSLVAIWLLPTDGVAAAPSATSMGFYLLVWGIFSTGMTVAAFKHNNITKIVFVSVTMLFFLLAIADFTGIHAIKTLAGYVGMFCGFSAMYSAVAGVINGEYGKTVLPVG